MIDWRALAAALVGAAFVSLIAGGVVTPSARGAGQFSLDWSMPDRYGDGNGDGLADTVYPPDGAAQIDPGGWRVDLTVSGASCGGTSSRSWWIEGVKILAGDPRLLAGGPSGCALSYRFPAEGVYEVAFEERDQAGNLLGAAKRAITVQDFFIVSIGDSVASGEGNPETPAPFAGWENGSDTAAQCHRSRYAGPSQAALALEKADPHTSVTFVHLACSGATTLQGLLGPELRGQGPVTVDQPAQLDQLPKLVDKREVDALTISIGANDVKFSTVVELCLVKSDCDVDAPGSAARLFTRQLQFLPGRYIQLGAALDNARIPRERAYISEYFDPTRDSAGDPCDGTILLDSPVPTRFSITAKEALWASMVMMSALNGAAQTAASNHGWRFVDGVRSQFLTHGYCAADSWVVHLSESLVNQGDKEGTLHPNGPGHAVYGDRIAATTRGDLYPGAAQTPRRPFQRLQLEGKGPNDSGYGDIVANAPPGATVQLRVQLNGDDTALKNVGYALQGPGTLSAGTGTTDSAGRAAFTYQAPTAGSCPDGPVCAVVTATLTDADGAHSDALSISVHGVTVTVSPSSTTLNPGQQAQFNATVTGTGNHAVTWRATGGTIDQSGLYTAGANPGTFSVTATSVADPTVLATATITITATIPMCEISCTYFGTWTPLLHPEQAAKTEVNITLDTGRLKGVIAPVGGVSYKYDVVLVRAGSGFTFTGPCQDCPSGISDIRGSVAGNGLDFTIRFYGSDAYQFTGSWIY